MTAPENVKYSKDHEWVKVEGNQVKIGITQFAQIELGDIVFVELPEIGDEIKANEPFGSLESVKTVSELYAPISGRVVEINKKLEDKPELVNSSPFEEGWMIVVEPTNLSEIDELLTQNEYKKLINEV